MQNTYQKINLLNLDNYDKDSFTLLKGIVVQNEQLAEWKKKLNKECYLDLVAECIKENQRLADDIAELLENSCAKIGRFIDMKNQGYSVFRGSALSCFVGNWKPKEERKE